MKNLGLVSISFRKLSTDEIIALCKENGLGEIEWGGDIHVPHGDVATAEKVYSAAAKAGIKTSAYGSYYTIAREKGENPDWDAVVDTAAALHAPIIRVWGFGRGSADIDDELFNKGVEECRSMCDTAAKHGITVCTECHNNTVTDDYHGALKFLHAVDRPNFKLYWQPNQFKSVEYNLETIAATKKYITNVHTFNWEGKNMYPMAEGLDIWTRYINALGDSASAYLFEFMPKGTPEELESEVAAFKSIL